MATVGDNFKRIRLQKDIKQEQIYKQLGFKRPSNVSLLETSRRLQKPATIRRMAAVLACETRELMDGVETPWDKLRQPDAIRQTNVSGVQTKPAEPAGSVQKHNGQKHAKAEPSGQTDPVLPAVPSTRRRRVLDGLVRAVGALERVQAVDGPPRAGAPRKHVAATRHRTPSTGVRRRKVRR